MKWPNKAQAEDYRALLISYVSPIDILVIGGKRIREMPQVHENGTIRMMTYTEIITQAESELRWLLDELAHEDSMD